MTQRYFGSTVFLLGAVTMSNNHLSIDKKIAVAAALAEGNSIRSIERMTGVHRDTIMRLGVRVGQGCARLLNEKMRGLDCQRIELDEIWGYIGKKMAHVREEAIRRLETFGPIARLMRTLNWSLLTRLRASATSRLQSNLSATLNHV